MSVISALYLNIINEVIKNGYALIDVKLPFLAEHRLAIKDFIQRRLAADDFEQWIYQVEGEDEAEHGLVKPRVGKDLKYSFHDSNYLRQELAGANLVLTPEDERFLELNKKLYDYASSLAANLINALGKKFKNKKLLYLYCEHVQVITPYSISILRNLFYPKAVEQKGAKKHIDKNLITIHFGDVGGNLVFYQDENDKIGQVLFIPEGQAVVFFGVKILWITKGKVQPLWHGSITEGGVERMANPFFAHVEVPGYVVKDAKEALDYYQSISR